MTLTEVRPSRTPGGLDRRRDVDHLPALVVLPWSILLAYPQRRDASIHTIIPKLENRLPPSRQPGRGIEPLLALRHKHNLHPILLGIRIPKAELPVLPLVQLPRRNLEPARLVRLRRHQQVLEVPIRLLHVLAEGAHNLPLGRHALPDIRILQLKQQALLPRVRVPHLCDLVTRAADLDDGAPRPARAEPQRREPRAHHAHGQARLRVDLALALLLLARRAPREVGLVLLALGVREVRAVVLVDCQAEAALEGAEVVAEDVGVLFEVDGLERELAEALAPVGVGGAVRGDAATAELGAGAVLVVHGGWGRGSKGLVGGS